MISKHMWHVGSALAQCWTCRITYVWVTVARHKFRVTENIQTAMPNSNALLWLIYKLAVLPFGFVEQLNWWNSICCKFINLHDRLVRGVTSSFIFSIHWHAKPSCSICYPLTLHIGTIDTDQQDWTVAESKDKVTRDENHIILKIQGAGLDINFRSVIFLNTRWGEWYRQARSPRTTWLSKSVQGASIRAWVITLNGLALFNAVQQRVIQ